MKILKHYDFIDPDLRKSFPYIELPDGFCAYLAIDTTDISLNYHTS